MNALAWRVTRWRAIEPGFARLLATLGALTLALLPHVARLPVWITAGLAVAMAARLAAEHRGWALPPRWLRWTAALAATAGVLVSYRTLNGLEAGTALLAVMAGLKLAETRAPRDHAVLVFIGYFLCLAALLQEQSFVQLAYAVAACWALTAALARVHRPVEANTPVRPFRLAGRVLLLGLPLAAILFMFVPRIEGRFWAVPTAADRGTTGIDEEMSPGDVAALGLSDDPAFRAWFTSPVPAPEDRYWRMLVLEQFDGRTWRRARDDGRREASLDVRGPTIDYRIALEPTQRQWLPALDYVTTWPESAAIRTRGLQLIRWDSRLMEAPRVTERFVYTARSAPQARWMADELPPDLALRNLALPEGRHPRTRALAAELRAASPEPREIVARALERFRSEPFEYVLEPPPLGADPVDEFLFETRAGFCEHYSSAFAVLMRAAGVPTRVVTGYQGGESNAYGGYLLVRQSTAHAWNEVWIAGEGWVRVDPTAAVAPERVRRGLLDGASVRGDVPGELYAEVPWLANLRSAWDAARTAWYDKVVGFSGRTQQALLERLGLGERGWQGLAIALAASFGMAALLMAAWLAWEFRPPRRDPVEVAWERVGERLAALGCGRAPHEGPFDYARRAAREVPAVAPRLQDLVDAYVGVRYLPGGTSSERDRFLALAREFVARPTIDGRRPDA